MASFNLFGVGENETTMHPNVGGLIGSFPEPEPSNPMALINNVKILFDEIKLRTGIGFFVNPLNGLLPDNVLSALGDITGSLETMLKDGLSLDNLTELMGSILDKTGFSNFISKTLSGSIDDFLSSGFGKSLSSLLATGLSLGDFIQHLRGEVMDSDIVKFYNKVKSLTDELFGEEFIGNVAKELDTMLGIRTSIEDLVNPILAQIETLWKISENIFLLTIKGMHAVGNPVHTRDQLLLHFTIMRHDLRDTLSWYDQIMSRNYSWETDSVYDDLKVACAHGCTRVYWHMWTKALERYKEYKYSVMKSERMLKAIENIKTDMAEMQKGILKDRLDDAEYNFDKQQKFLRNIFKILIVHGSTHFDVGFYGLCYNKSKNYSNDLIYPALYSENAEFAITVKELDDPMCPVNEREKTINPRNSYIKYIYIVLADIQSPWKLDASTVLVHEELYRRLTLVKDVHKFEYEERGEGTLIPDYAKKMDTFLFRPLLLDLGMKNPPNKLPKPYDPSKIISPDEQARIDREEKLRYDAIVQITDLDIFGDKIYSINQKIKRSNDIKRVLLDKEDFIEIKDLDMSVVFEKYSITVNDDDKDLSYYHLDRILDSENEAYIGKMLYTYDTYKDRDIIRSSAIILNTIIGILNLPVKVIDATYEDEDASSKDVARGKDKTIKGGKHPDTHEKHVTPIIDGDIDTAISIDIKILGNLSRIYEFADRLLVEKTFLHDEKLFIGDSHYDRQKIKKYAWKYKPF